MKIGYYVPPTLLAHRGIGRRVEATLDAWSRLGHEPSLVSEAATGGLPALTHLRGDRAAARTLSRGGLSDAIDHLHVRLFLPTLGWATLDEGLPLSIEVHAGLWRPENRRDLVRVSVGAFSSRMLVQRSRTGAFITSELSQRKEFLGLPVRVVIGNGVELGDPYPAPSNPRPRVGMVVGTPAGWHGLDRFISLAAHNPEFDFVVIAPQASSAYLRREVGSALEVTLTKTHGDYERALASLDLAVGSMALERKGLTEAAPLKVRDYIRAGVPTAFPFRDTNLSGIDDGTLLEWDGLPGDVFASWAEQNVGERVGEAAREAISIDAVEARRIAGMDPRGS